MLGMDQALPTSHLLQSLVASVGVAFALEQSGASVVNDVSLSGKICKRVATNVLSLESDALALTKTATRAVESIGTGQELLSLFQLVVASRVIGVASIEQSRLVARKPLELCLSHINVGCIVAETLVRLGLLVRRQVLFLQSHGVQLDGYD